MQPSSSRPGTISGIVACFSGVRELWPMPCGNICRKPRRSSKRSQAPLEPGSLPGKFVAAVGVNNLVVVETDDDLLITTREQAQDVGKIVKYLDEKRLHRLV